MCCQLAKNPEIKNITAKHLPGMSLQQSEGFYNFCNFGTRALLSHMGLASFMPHGFHKETTQNLESKVNSTGSASNKNKTFHRQAFCAAHRLSSGL